MGKVENDEQKKIKRNNSIDMIKLVCACLVVSIHIKPLFDLSESAGIFLTEILSRIAVPFFFAVSGYFFASKWKGEKRYLGKAVCGLMRYYAVFSVFYILWDALKGSYADFSAAELAKLLIQRILFYGAYYHLWYFPSAIASLCVLYICEKRKIWKYVAAVSLLFFAGGALTYTWNVAAVSLLPVLETLEENFYFDYLRRFLCDAIPFTMMGAVIWHTQIQWQTVKRSRSLLCCPWWLVVNTAETGLALFIGADRGTTLSFSLMPLVCTILMLALQRPACKWERVGSFCRETSIVVYGMHPLLLEIIWKLMPAAWNVGETAVFSLVLTVCLVLSFCLWHVEQRRCEN